MNERRDQAARGDVIGRIAAQHGRQVRYARGSVVEAELVFGTLKFQQADRVAEVSIADLGLLAQSNLFPFRPGGANGLRRADDGANDEHQEDGRGCCETQLVSANQLLQEVKEAGRARVDWLIAEKALDIGGEAARGFVAARAVLFEALHDDPIQIASNEEDSFCY